MALDVKGKEVLVVGLGRSGVAACKLLRRLGAAVQAVDRRNRRSLSAVKDLQSSSVRIHAGRDRFDPARFDLIIVSPGVPWDHPDLTRARENGVPVMPEFELGWRSCRPRLTVAVTGTNGKTTTTALLGHLFKKAGRRTVVAGNIGPPVSAVAGRVRPSDILVLELSSYQLEAHSGFRPDIGVWLNLTSDHLGRHRTMAAYARIKSRLFANATRREWAVLNRRDRWCRRAARDIPARVIWFPSPKITPLLRDFSLPGAHNRENAFAAATAARCAGLPAAAIRAGLRSFRGVPHRLQTVRRARGVTWINDSKATNVDSTRVALDAASGPVLLILGGEHKGAPYTGLAPAMRRAGVRRVFAIGEAASLIVKDLGKRFPVHVARTLSEAVRLAAAEARAGDSVLLSPACASFDQFKDFEERGRRFVALVKALR